MAALRAAIRTLRTRPVHFSTRSMSSVPAAAPKPLPQFETLRVTPIEGRVLHVELNRPEKRNAMNVAFWREMVECFSAISQDSSYNAVVISGAGPMFTAGIDLVDMGKDFMLVDGEDTARKAWQLRHKIRAYQESFSVLEKCPKPVIAAVHGACVGAGVDLVSACDIRYCSQDAWFQVKEVDIGLAADVGTLQRLPKIMGSQSLVNELAFTARKMMAPEALRCGFVSPQPRGRSEHQDQPRLLAGPPGSRQPSLHGRLEHEHAADRRHPKVGSGRDGEEGTRSRHLFQAVGSERPIPTL